MPINPRDARPLSAQITEDLRRQITAGDFNVGDKLPSLRALAEQYGVAELTVHAAIKELQHDNVLVSVSGRGTFVRSIPQPDAASEDSDSELHAEVEALRGEVRELRSRVDAVEDVQAGSSTAES